MQNMSSNRLRHLRTNLGAMPAGSSAFATVPHFRMIFAFLSAIVARNFAKMTQLSGEFAIKAHDLGGSIAKSGAFKVELDAADHALHILFQKTGGSALMTKSGTVAAGLHAGLVLLW
jgi:hypothetical protein